MAVELLKNEYETPRVQIRGVFLCDEIAVPVSVLTWGIDQDDWTGSEEKTIGDGLSDPEGNINLFL